MSLSSTRLGSLSSKEEGLSPRREDKSQDPIDSPAGGLVQRCVIIQRDERGYGLTVSGDNPVFVQSVKDHGAAARAGVQQGDRIVKVNGTLVINSNHIEVVKLIKSGSYVALTLLGRPLGQQTKDSPQTPPVKATSPPVDKTPVSTPDRTSITGPQPVDARKQEELTQLKLDTLKAMHNKAIAEYQNIRKDKDYGRNPEKLKGLLEDKLKTVKTLENQLHSVSPTDSYIISLSNLSRDSGTSDSLEPSLNQDVFDQPTYRHPSWLPAGPRHAKTGSVPVSIYASPDSSSRVNLPRSQSDAYTKHRLTSIESASALQSGSRPVRSESAKTSESKSLPSTVLDGTSMPHSPQLTPNTSPTPTHPQNRHDSDSLDADSRDSRRDSGVHVGTMSLEDSTPSAYRKVNPQQAEIISAEDDEFSEEEEDSEDHGPFMALTLLEKKPAHMAIFLHYLISNSDPSPLFFCIVADVYENSQASYKDLRKWAYEITATFLANNAPLRVEVDDYTLSTIEDILQSKNDKEDLLRMIFHSAKSAAMNITDELLADFRRQKSLGLGNIYGVHELQDSQSKQKDMQIINKYLSPHLDGLLPKEEENTESSHRNEAMAAALVTFFKHVGGIKSTLQGTQIDRVPSFVAKDKRSIKFPVMTNKKNSITLKGHSLTAQHFSQITHCAHCHNMIGGLGYPGYTCSSCEMHFHKYCISKMEECCGKKKKRMSVLSDIIRKQSNVTNPATKDSTKSHDDKVDPSASPGPPMFEIKSLADEKDPDLNRLKEQGHSVGNLVQIYEHTGKSPESEQTPATKKKGTEIGRSESMKGRGDQRSEKSSGTRRTKRPHELSYTDIRDVDVDETLKSLNNSGSSSTSSLSTSNSSEAVHELKQLIEDDSDFDVEPELPPLKQLFTDDTVKKLKPKEKKRQEVINELFYTERSHVRNMKVLDRVFFRPMTAEPHVIHQGLVNQLFPNLEQLINLHSSLNNAMKNRRKENPVVGEVGDILLQRFDGEAGSEFREGCAIFCRNQSYALEQLRIKQRRDEKFSRLLAEAESNPLCRRLQLKDLIPTAFQRLTKYPLLIENLMKYTQTNSEDYSRLERALKRSKSILDYVNQAVRECENHQRLVEINKRVDRRPFENSNNPDALEYKNLDLTKRKLVHDGMLSWRLSRNKQIDLHVVLLEDILVLLQKQDDRLVLKCQSTLKSPVVAGKDDTKDTHSPVIRLTNLLTRNVATDKKAFFLVSNPNLKPQIYELVSSSSEDRKRWFKHITDACESYKNPKNDLHSQKDNSSNQDNQSRQRESEQITEIRPQITSPDRQREGSGWVKHNNNPADPCTNHEQEVHGLLPDIQTHRQDQITVVRPQIITRHGHRKKPRENSEGVSGSPTPCSASNVVERDDPWVERVGISDHISGIDHSQLIQPEDVTVTDPEISVAEPVLTPQEKLRRADNQLRQTLAEKEQIAAEILGVSLDQSHLSAEQLSLDLDSDPRDLVAAAIQQHNEILALLSECCVPGPSDKDSVQSSPSSASRNAAVTPTPENSTASPSQPAGSMPIPMDKLRLMAGRMNSILSNLLTVVGNKEEEQDRLRQELKSAQQQLAMVKELKGSNFYQSERPSSMVSVGSSVSESLEETQASVDELHRMLMGDVGSMIRAEDVLMADSTFTQSTDLDCSDWADVSELDTADGPNKQQVTDVDDEIYSEDKGGSSGEEGSAKFFPAEETLEATGEQSCAVEEDDSGEQSANAIATEEEIPETVIHGDGEVEPADSTAINTDQSESSVPDTGQRADEGTSVDSGAENTDSNTTV
ncbi:rho guanine nucleotide exchange factor 11-like isoform X3 [Liolophura sinensis]|uniref:rho guanine nucleotide exchange factor 11-like isoform X3 n=1 Tax=Liolophura sinensis TaxID=3198878 RepID=UPI003159829B